MLVLFFNKNALKAIRVGLSRVKKNLLRRSSEEIYLLKVIIQK